jgi:hypothetical protein
LSGSPARRGYSLIVLPPLLSRADSLIGAQPAAGIGGVYAATFVLSPGCRGIDRERAHDFGMNFIDGKCVGLEYITVGIPIRQLAINRILSQIGKGNATALMICWTVVPCVPSFSVAGASYHDAIAQKCGLTDCAAVRRDSGVSTC